MEFNLNNFHRFDGGVFKVDADEQKSVQYYELTMDYYIKEKTLRMNVDFWIGWFANGI